MKQLYYDKLFKTYIKYILLLLALSLLSLNKALGQKEPFPLANRDYYEHFDKISEWGNNFQSGIGASYYGVAAAPLSALPTAPNQTGVFTNGFTGGVQKGAGGMMLLATGTITGENAAAADLYLDFSNTTAGIIDIKWESRNNGITISNRQSLFKVQTNTGEGGAFVDLPNTAVTITNYDLTKGIIQAKLPAAFDGKANARVRLYLVTTDGGSTGSRPKFFIDRVVVTATPIPVHLPKITTLRPSQTLYEISETTGSQPFQVPYEYNGTFTGTWKAQLSDARGIFSMDLDENILGTSGTATGALQAKIPAGTPCGNGYRIRVLNTEPLRYGIEYTSDLTVIYPNEVTVSPATAQVIRYPDGEGSTLTATTSATGESAFTWKYSTTSGGPFVNALPDATTNSYTVRSEDFPAPGRYYVVAEVTSVCGAVSNSEPVMVVLQGLAVDPVALSFGDVAVGRTSDAQTFELVGWGIAGNVTVTPPAGFELYVAGVTGYTDQPFTLIPDDGVLKTTVAVRFAPTAMHAYKDHISVSGELDLGGVSTVQVAVSGMSTIASPVLTTAPVTDVTASGAASGGDISTSGGPLIIAKGIVWSQFPNPSLEDNEGVTDEGIGNDSFSSTMSGLEQNTVYYVRAYATNGWGTSYGRDIKFVTKPAAPSQQAFDITGSNIGTEKITITWTNGNGTGRLVKVNTVNDFTDPEDGVDIEMTSPVYKSEGEQNVYRGDDSRHSLTITGLEPGTAYWIRIYELNNDNENVRYNTSVANANPVKLWTITPLPVELVRFHASLLTGGTVALEWKTASELNNSHFTIRRSTDGRQFETIGRVKGFGTSSIPREYTFPDKKPPRGTVYYMLVQVDLDGTSTRSMIASVMNTGRQDPTLKAFPNPVQEILKISNLEDTEVTHYVVFSISGRAVLKKACEEKDTADLSVNVSSLPDGPYFLQLYTTKGTRTIRFLKAPL